MEEYEDFRYIDASVSTGSLASSEKSLLTRSSECSSIVSGTSKGEKLKNGIADIELIKLRAGQSSAAVAVKKVDDSNLTFFDVTFLAIHSFINSHRLAQSK